VTFLVLAVLSLAGFLWWDWRPENPAPVLHLRVIWRQGPLRTSLTVVMVVGSLLGAGLYVLPQYLRNVQNYSSAQTGGFISAFTAGLGIGLVITLRYMLPRIGGRRVVLLGSAMMCAACVNYIYVWTPTTPTWVLAACTFAQGFSIAPMLLGASNVATGQASLADANDVSTSFFFVRQLGNTFGVTAATVLFDRRMTVHSSRLLDAANRLNPTTQSTLGEYAGLIARNAGAGFDPSLGALQIFQSNLVVQSELLSYIDIYFMLVGLAAIAMVLVVMTDAQKATAPPRMHIHFW
jgi:DHA2 family multidrug resistance protein